MTDDGGRQLDAEYTVETDGDHLAFILDSMSGRAAGRAPRNTDYRVALELALARLKERGGVIEAAVVDSQVTQRLQLPESERSLVPGRVELAGEDPAVLRRQLTSAQTTIAQRSDARLPGNSTKRIRLRLTVPGYRPEDAGRLEADLEHGPASKPQADLTQSPAHHADVLPDAVELLRKLEGEDVITLTGGINKILDVRPSDVLVATNKSPTGQPVPIAMVQDALDRLAAEGSLLIDVTVVGYRSAFIGAVLRTVPGTRVEPGSPPVIVWDPATIVVDDATGVLTDDDPLWHDHSGGSGHDADPEWLTDEDLQRATAFYAQMTGKAKLVIDLLIDHPGRLLGVDQIMQQSAGAIDGAHAIAGALRPLERLQTSAGRRYPFYWWSNRSGPTRYGMKPAVAELFRQARAASPAYQQPAETGDPQVLGTPYRPQADDIEPAPPTPGAPRNPDKYGDGLRAHRWLQNSLAEQARAHDFEPVGPLPAEPAYDIAWTTGNGSLIVIEVKSSTASNEVQQLRTGLGQVLDYANALQRPDRTVQAAIYLQREPAQGHRWTAITGNAGVLLAWPGTEDRLGLPRTAPAVNDIQGADPA